MAQQIVPKRLAKRATRVFGRLADEKRGQLARAIKRIDAEMGDRGKKASPARIALAKLKVARLREGLSLGEIAAKTGIDRGNLSKLENNVDNVELNTLTRFADALGYDVVVKLRKRS